MLDELHIENYALIDRATISFSKGLNVLTGETGAGKSILVGAIGLLLGDKGDKTAVRTGYDDARVTGIVHIEDNKEALQWLESKDIKHEDGYVFIRRNVKTTGRGSIQIQSVPVTRGELEEFSTLLFDMHGQHQHQSLLNVDKHRLMLDRYGNLEALAAEVKEFYTTLTELRKEMDSLVAADEDRERELELLKYAVNEINSAALKPGEEGELESEWKILSEGEKLFNLLDAIHSLGIDESGGFLHQIKKSSGLVGEVAEIDTGLSKLSDRFESAYYEIEDVFENLRDYQNNIDFSEERFNIVESRIAEIQKLKKKYGGSIEDILEYCAQCEEKIDHFTNSEEYRSTLADKIGLKENELLTAARKLSVERAKVAASLEKGIENSIRSLGMKKAAFRISCKPRVSSEGKALCNANGLDAVEYLISPNQGEPLKPLKNIASGGEISRIMLALKSILADSDNIHTLIFDEIDTGIGGEVALSVGEHLKKLATRKQILSITHLATIASFADKHIKVEKGETDSRTITDIFAIEGDRRIEEIARMLSGTSGDLFSLQHAEELVRRNCGTS